jgi:hypothetical protein
MFAWVKKASSFLHQTFDKCMGTPDYNSRLVFLGTAIFTQAIIIWHTAAYLHSPAKDSNYPTILAILLGGHGVNSFGRFMTKRVKEKQDADKDAGSDQPKG